MTPVLPHISIRLARASLGTFAHDVECCALAWPKFACAGERCACTIRRGDAAHEVHVESRRVTLASRGRASARDDDCLSLVALQEIDLDALYVRREEQDAVLAIDVQQLRKILDQCLQGRSHVGLRDFRLESCGAYIASELRGYEAALSDFWSAKAAKRVELTHRDAQRAGNRLTSAVLAMVNRVNEERKESERFRIDDLVSDPHRLSEQLRVVVRYHWRSTTQEEWQSGSIEFTHTVNLRSDYTQPRPARKPSAARQVRAEQDKLYAEWSHLRRLGLHAVREFFREGGDPATIPKTFQAIIEGRRGLTNFSTDFWPRQRG